MRDERERARLRLSALADEHLYVEKGWVGGYHAFTAAVLAEWPQIVPCAAPAAAPGAAAPATPGEPIEAQIIAAAQGICRQRLQEYCCTHADYNADHIATLNGEPMLPLCQRPEQWYRPMAEAALQALAGAPGPTEPSRDPAAERGVIGDTIQAYLVGELGMALSPAGQGILQWRVWRALEALRAGDAPPGGQP